jgi:hypothetical protein
MSETQFTVEEIERDGEKMLRIETLDTSNSISEVTNSVILTQNLEAYIGSDTLSENSTENYNDPLNVSDIEFDDIVVDLEEPQWSDDRLMRVTEVTSVPANEYNMGDGETLADKNPNYPEYSPVIFCTPSDETDIQAYPYDRIEFKDRPKQRV